MLTEICNSKVFSKTTKLIIAEAVLDRSWERKLQDISKNQAESTDLRKQMSEENPRYPGQT